MATGAMTAPEFEETEGLLAPRAWPAESDLPVHPMNTFTLAYNPSSQEFELTLGHSPVELRSLVIDPEDDYDVRRATPQAGDTNLLGRFIMTRAVLAAFADGLQRAAERLSQSDGV